MSIKGLNFGAHIRKHINIFPDDISLDERHSLKATVLESVKKCINWVSVDNFETLSQTYR